MLERYKDQILNIVFGKIKKDECIIFLFGTYASGKEIRSSDIDIGILCNHKIPAGDFVEIQENLDKDIPMLRQIDFVDFASVDEKVKGEALKEAKIWHTGKNCQELLKSLKRARRN